MFYALFHSVFLKYSLVHLAPQPQYFSNILLIQTFSSFPTSTHNCVNKKKPINDISVNITDVYSVWSVNSAKNTSDKYHFVAKTQAYHMCKQHA